MKRELKQERIIPEVVEVSKISITLPKELKREFKKATFLNDITMNKAILKFIESYVQENPVPPVPEIRRIRLRKPANRKKAGVVNEI